MRHASSRRARLAGLACAALLGTGVAQADIVGFEFIAQVTNRSADPANPDLALPPQLTVGDQVVGRIQYETIIPDSNADPNRGQYNNLVREFVVLVDGLGFVFLPGLPGSSNFGVVRNDYLPPNSPTRADSFSLIGLNGWPPFSPPNATFQVGLFGIGSSNTVSSDALPPFMPVFGDWTVFWVIFNGPNLYSSATATIRELRPIGPEVVPEPGTLGLMLLGFGAVAVPGLRVRVRRKVARMVSN